MDKPLPLRYGHWLKSVGHGDLGYSYRGGPVAPLLRVRGRNTLFLVGTATALLI
jgi:ABC-type dipeptide/oligopeptide/nickel transport system permease component